MNCAHCARGREVRAYPLADAACPGCTARAIAGGHWCRWSQEAGSQLPAYRDQLDRAGVTHEEVRQWLPD